MLRQLELDRLDALARALADAGSAIARARVAAETAGAAGAVAPLADVEQWTARSAADIRTRAELVADTPVFQPPVYRGLLRRVRPRIAGPLNWW